MVGAIGSIPIPPTINSPGACLGGIFSTTGSAIGAFPAYFRALAVSATPISWRPETEMQAKRPLVSSRQELFPNRGRGAGLRLVRTLGRDGFEPGPRKGTGY